MRLEGRPQNESHHAFGHGSRRTSFARAPHHEVSGWATSRSPNLRLPRRPHPAQARADVDGCALCGGCGGGDVAGRPGAALEAIEDRRRNETGARGIHVTIAVGALLMHEEALRDREMQMILGAGHRDIEQAPLLLELGGAAGAEIGGDAAVDHVQQEDRGPFLPLGGMDGGEDEVVLVEHRHARFVTGGVGRIQRELGEEALAARIGRGDLRQLRQIGLADGGIVVDAREMRRIPAAHQIELGRPARGLAAQQAYRVGEIRPVGQRRGGRHEGFQRR